LLRAPSRKGDELQEEEVRAHGGAAHQEKAQVKFLNRFFVCFVCLCVCCFVFVLALHLLRAFPQRRRTAGRRSAGTRRKLRIKKKLK
jgi:hypothetical protein